MNCPVHVGTEMRVVPVTRPFFGLGGRRKNFIRITARDRARKILRCPVAGCPCVAAPPSGDGGLAVWQRERYGLTEHFE